MGKKLAVAVTTSLLIIGVFFIGSKTRDTFTKMTGAPPYLQEDLEPPEADPYGWIRDWSRPDGPAKVGLQVGHWKNEELPDELARLRGNTGSSGGGKSEWEVNLAIANLTAEILRQRHIEVDILPATIPKGFWADVFVAIHADGSEDRRSLGFKAATPRRDFSGGASKLLALIEEEYAKATGLTYDPNISRNMTGYYAFSWWRYEHAVHPRTASVILETGFLTNANDRRIIVDRPDLSATGLAEGIIRYLVSENLL